MGHPHLTNLKSVVAFALVNILLNKTYSEHL